MSKQIDPSVGELTTKDPNTDGSINPDTFDLAGWLAGVQPTRRRVTIYGRGDLQAEIDELSAAEAVARGAEQKRLAVRLAELTAELQASAMTFEIEGRTSTWVAKVADELRKNGVPAEEVDLGLLAAQIVSPAVTIDQIKALREVREADVLRLVDAVVNANSRPVGLDPRFLRGASD